MSEKRSSSGVRSPRWRRSSTQRRERDARAVGRRAAAPRGCPARRRRRSRVPSAGPDRAPGCLESSSARIALPPTPWPPGRGSSCSSPVASPRHLGDAAGQLVGPDEIDSHGTRPVCIGQRAFRLHVAEHQLHRFSARAQHRREAHGGRAARPRRTGRRPRRSGAAARAACRARPAARGSRRRRSRSPPRGAGGRRGSRAAGRSGRRPPRRAARRAASRASNTTPV